MQISKTTWSIIFFLNWTYEQTLNDILQSVSFFIPIEQKLVEKIATLYWRVLVSCITHSKIYNFKLTLLKN